ncbi:hypothetical protein D3C83_104020 [compost metagenome]
MLVRRRAGRLDDDDVVAADVLENLDARLAVAELADVDAPGPEIEVPRDAVRELGMGAAGEESQVLGFQAGRP